MGDFDNYLNLQFSILIHQSPRYQEALGIIRDNTFGNAWLVGGSVYRLATHILYQSPVPVVDLDFVVESRYNIALPKGWSLEQNKFENPKFRNGDKTIDVVPLETVYSIVQRGLSPQIAHYLTGVPLTIQSIAFDVNNHRLIGDIGLSALKSKTVGINSKSFAEYAARKKGLQSVEELVVEKADSLGFKAHFD